jgi:hypothetical protein
VTRSRVSAVHAGEGEKEGGGGERDGGTALGSTRAGPEAGGGRPAPTRRPARTYPPPTPPALVCTLVAWRLALELDCRVAASAAWRWRLVFGSSFASPSGWCLAARASATSGSCASGGSGRCLCDWLGAPVTAP